MNKNILYNLPCVGGMKKHINDNTVDIIITDPPFAINFKADKKNYNRDKSKVIKEYNEVSPDQYSQFTLEWLTESKRILKENGSIYICSGWNYVDEISQSLKKLNFKIINHIIWKYSFGVYCKKRFVSSHFHILYACLNDKKRSEKFNTNCRYKDNDLIDKTNKKALYADMEDVWIINKENWSGKITTANKLPGELIKKMLSYSSQKGDLIVDPFCGSGQVLWYAREHGLNYIAFEKSKQAYNFAKYRLDNNQYLVDKSDWEKVFKKSY